MKFFTQKSRNVKMYLTGSHTRHCQTLRSLTLWNRADCLPVVDAGVVSILLSIFSCCLSCRWLQILKVGYYDGIFLLASPAFLERRGVLLSS